MRAARAHPATLFQTPVGGCRKNEGRKWREVEGRAQRKRGGEEGGEGGSRAGELITLAASLYTSQELASAFIPEFR